MGGDPAKQYHHQLGLRGACLQNNLVYKALADICHLSFVLRSSYEYVLQQHDGTVAP
jgi:hypothetical protein